MTLPEWPLFVVRDDAVLEICESLEDARRDYEGIDVESGVYHFVDSTGVVAKPIFTTPNEHSKVLGLISTCSSGVFEFEQAGRCDDEAVERFLDGVDFLETNTRFSTLDEVRDHLKSAVNATR